MHGTPIWSDYVRSLDLLTAGRVIHLQRAAMER
jgi:hypothetical protein